jgi:hypothetical protein
LQKGNFQMMAITMAMLAMILFERRRCAAGGALLAFATVSKLYPGMLLLYLLARRDWRAVAWTTAMGAVFVVLGILTFVLPATAHIAMLGLGFGDCGKGLFVDALTRRWQAHTVVRFNGGAQAGHNVVTPSQANSPSRHHTFSQFGAGTIVPGVRTLLLDPMVVHPTGLLVEAEVLGKIGLNDALSRLTIDAHCRITTPFHQAAGCLRTSVASLNNEVTTTLSMSGLSGTT